MSEQNHSTHKGPGLQWLLNMAWRDSRKARGRLILFTISIVLGISALVAISSFGDNLESDIDNQAAELLGADLEVQSRRFPEEKVARLLDSLDTDIGAIQKAEEASFPSMAFFPKTKDSRLVQIKALEGNFPFYGKMETRPDLGKAGMNQDRAEALVDQGVMLQFGIEAGDTVRVGQQKFEISASLIQAPGQNQMSMTVAPTVYIPKKYLDATGLVRKGSRVNYAYYYQYPKGFDTDELVDSLKSTFRALSLRTNTIEERKNSLSDAFGNMTRFLNLVAFIALLLGCLGVASAVHIYIKGKISTVAILRCLGVKGRQAFLIYLIQILVMGLIGSLIGVALGALIQQLLPVVLKAFLPFEATNAISWPSIARGFVIGIGISVLFALLPLLSIRKVSPLFTLRASFEGASSSRDPLRWLVFLMIGVFVYGFTYLQLGGWVEALAFTGAIAAGFLLLVGAAKLAMWLVKRFFPRNWSFIARQGLSNLYRPNNQTLILIVSIGLGTSMISTLYFMQSLLLGQLNFGNSVDSPNILLFDIQSHQREALASLTRENDLPVLQQIPIVTMRMHTLKGMSQQEVREDSTQNLPGWVFNNELRVTFRDSLVEGEEILEGQWRGRNEASSDTVFISLEEGFAKRTLKVDVGDPIEFNVQGAIIPTVVGSIRKMEFDRMNFLILFPEGPLEKAPQFHVLTTRADSVPAAVRYQQAVVRQFPTVSVIDLGQVLSTIETILDKVAFVVQFMALFSIITGLLVLVGSVIISKYQRIQESVLLRTMGANQRQVLLINGMEYAMLGALASLTGIILSLFFSWGLAVFSFDAPFRPNWIPIIIMFVGITVLTVTIGLLNIRGILNKPPLEVLRKEV